MRHYTSERTRFSSAAVLTTRVPVFFNRRVIRIAYCYANNREEGLEDSPCYSSQTAGTAGGSRSGLPWETVRLSMDVGVDTHDLRPWLLRRNCGHHGE